jgi:DNA-binding transcriptional MerR regulator
MTIELSIQQVSARTGISCHTLRYYERMGLILDINRIPSGHRRYDDNDLEWIAFLKQLKATGMPLVQMQYFAQLRRQGKSTAKQRREMLEAHRQTVIRQIQMLNDSLTIIDHKIERHRQNEKATQ